MSHILVVRKYKSNEQLAGICTGASGIWYGASGIWYACSSELHCNMFQQVFGNTSQKQVSMHVASQRDTYLTLLQTTLQLLNLALGVAQS